MKTIISSSILSLFFFLVPNLLRDGMLTAQAIDLSLAVEKGLVALEASSLGGHSGECLKIKMENLSRKKLNVRIPAGQIFQATDPELQDIMVGKEETLLVEKGKTRIARLVGFCVEASDGSPGEASSFSLGKMAGEKLLQLAEYLSKYGNHKNPSAQYAVWAVSDEERLESVGDPGLTKFVADLLDKPMPDYHIQYQPPPPDEIITGRPANELRDAVSMNGIFRYDLERDKLVSFGLYDQEGELVVAFTKDRIQKRGQHKFRFNFEIRNLPAGKYWVKLKHQEEVIKEMEVEF